MTLNSEQEQALATLLGELRYTAARTALALGEGNPVLLVEVVAWVTALNSLSKRVIDLEIDFEAQATHLVRIPNAALMAEQIARIYDLDSLRVPDTAEGLG